MKIYLATISQIFGVAKACYNHSQTSKRQFTCEMPIWVFSGQLLQSNYLINGGVGTNHAVAGLANLKRLKNLISNQDFFSLN